MTTPQDARRIVWRRLDEARALKRRIDAGEALPSEPARLAAAVHEARVYHRIARQGVRPSILPDVQAGLSYRLVSNPRKHAP